MSAVGTWVWVPTTRLARPSHQWPSAIFSEVASAWTSTITAAAVPPRVAGRSAASIAEKGSSKGRFMNTCPSTWATKTRRPPGASKKRAPCPGAAAGVVERPQDARLLLDEGEHVALVEGMVAEGQAVGAGVEQELRVRGAQAHAAGGVLAVDHHEVEPPVAAQARQLARDRGATASVP